MAALLSAKPTTRWPTVWPTSRLTRATGRRGGRAGQPRCSSTLAGAPRRTRSCSAARAATKPREAPYRRCCTGGKSAIVLDPSLELSPMLADARRRMQHEVFTLHPETAHVVGFNALEWIDIDFPMAETDILSVVEWICGEVPSDNATAAFFMGRGKALVACLLAHMLWAEDLSAELKTLRTLRAALVTPRVRAARDPVGNSPILALSHGPRSRRHPEGSRRRDFQRYLCERRRVHVLAFQSGLCRTRLPERRSAPLTLRTGGRRCSLPCRSRPCRARRPWPVP